MLTLYKKWGKNQLQHGRGSRIPGAIIKWLAYAKRVGESKRMPNNQDGSNIMTSISILKLNKLHMLST